MWSLKGGPEPFDRRCVPTRYARLRDGLLPSLLEGLERKRAVFGTHCSSSTGYDERALDELLDELEPPALAEEVPPPPAESRTKSGQVIALGDHLLACGDARDPEKGPSAGAALLSWSAR